MKFRIPLHFEAIRETFLAELTEPANQPDTCGPRAGTVVPVIDRNRCEAESQCVAVCPYHVFELLPLTADDRAQLSIIGRLKAWAHGGKQAYAVRAEDCHACALCVAACPEQAIKLTTS